MTLGNLRGDLEPELKGRQWKMLKRGTKLGQAKIRHEILTRVQTKAPPPDGRRGRDPQVYMIIN